jgi:hypothetical protein
MDATPAFNILAISGIKVEQEIDLGSGVSLVPFDFIPDCIVKECFKLTDKIIQDPRTTISVMPGTRTSESALIKKIAIKPKSHKQEEGTVYRLDTEKLYQVCDCLTLVTNSSPVPLASWTVLENWVPCSSMLQCGWGGQGFDRTNISTYKLTQKNCEDASSIIRKYFELNKNIQDLLRISLQRLNLSRRRNSPVDRAIDLGIALESLLLHDGTPDAQISFPFRLRGAWLLGQDGTSRRNYYKLFKELYELRCKAVHNGRFDTKFSKKANDLLKKGDELCIGVIAWILEHKRMPNWEGLVLDDVNRLESGKYA